MTLGQGASMALPIFAYYMKKVYNDPHLGYSQEEKFDIPDNFNPCAIGDEDDDVDAGEVLEVVGSEEQESQHIYE
jgi:penicillin-binding protein 1A